MGMKLEFKLLLLLSMVMLIGTPFGAWWKNIHLGSPIDPGDVIFFFAGIVGGIWGLLYYLDNRKS